METKELAKSLVKRHEGLKLAVYKDSVGVPTIGWGRNLADRGISAGEAEQMLCSDVDYFLGKMSVFGWFVRLDNVRQAAIVDMAFNLGIKGLLRFVDMIDALAHGNWKLAAEHCLHSRWAKQVGNRAIEIAGILEKGIVSRGT